MNANNNIKNILNIVVYGIIIAVLTITPLGFIPFIGFRITTLHIPVILAAITLKPKQGIIVGLLFALSSMIYATIIASPESYLFSPVYGGINAFLIATLPRILLPIFTYLVFKKSNNVVLTSFIGTVFHTIAVLTCLYIFTLNTALNPSIVALFNVFVGINGFLEALLAAILVPILFKTIKKI